MSIFESKQLDLRSSDGLNVKSLTYDNAINSNDVYLKSEAVNLFKGFKNYLINGNFDVWQYKNAGLTYPQTSSGYGSADRWYCGNSGSTKTHSQVATTDTERALFNASYFSRTVVTSVAGVSNYVLLQQAIENVTKLAGKTVTLSFWAKADASKNISVNVVQLFGTGGSPSSFVDGTRTLVALTNTWQKKTITLTIPSIIGKTLGTDGVHTTATWLRFGFDAGSSTGIPEVGQQSGTFDIAQVQLEEGSVATPFEQRPYGLELSLCQRYYETGAFFAAGYNVTGSSIGSYLTFKNNKRIAPTIINTTTSQTNCGGLGYTFINLDGIALYSSVTTTGGAQITGTYTASAEL